MFIRTILVLFFASWWSVIASAPNSGDALLARQTRNDVRAVTFSSHWPDTYHAKRSVMQVTIPEIVMVTSSSTSTSDVADIEERGALIDFLWAGTTVLMGGTWYGAIGNVLGWGCSIASFLVAQMPSWTNWACGAVSFLSAITNVYQGKGTIQAAWNALQNSGATQPDVELDYFAWFDDFIAGYEKRSVACDWCEAMNDAVYAEVANRTVGGTLQGVHFHTYDNSLSVLPLQALMGSSESSAIPFVASINGTLAHLGAKMWVENNGTHAGFVSLSIPSHLVTVNTTGTKRQTDVNGIYYDDNDYLQAVGQDGEEYGGYYGVYFGDDFYGDEDQFWEVDNDVGGEGLGSNGAVYVGAGIATNLVNEGAVRSCICMQTDYGTWVSTGATQLGTGPDTWGGYDDCWNADCNN